MDVVDLYSKVIGAVGGTVALILAVDRLWGRFGRPRLDIRWKWKTTDEGAIGWAGFYLINVGRAKVIIDHVAFRWRANEQEPWHFVDPPEEWEQRLPAALASGDYSEVFGVSISDAALNRDDLLGPFVAGRESLVRITAHGHEFEFHVPAQEMKQPQQAYSYEV